MKATVHDDQYIYIFLSYLAKFFLEWEIFQTKFAQKIKTHILCSVTPAPQVVSFVKYCNKKNIVEPGRSQMTIWRMRFPCWIHEAKHTHLDYVMVFPFPQQ
jgi:hypothetical protein